MATYITGDKHGHFEELTAFIDRFHLTSDDTIIVLGDLGLYWRKDGKDAQYILDTYEKNYNTHILWIDGNHENFDLIDKLKYESGSDFKYCSQHIHYIPRSTVFCIQTDDGLKTCLACGGADSVDRFLRKPHLTWWKQEQITEDDVQKCINNTKDKHIDYIFTHACPHSIFNSNKVFLSTIDGLDEDAIDHTSENRLDTIAAVVDCKHHYFGHYHVNKALNDKYTCLYNEFIRL